MIPRPPGCCSWASFPRPDMLVVGEARDGREAVALTQKLRPDVVTMDLHMPRMDGLAATKEIMITAPTPIVIATGSTAAGEVATAHARAAGRALAVLRKPPGPGAPGHDEAVRKLVAHGQGDVPGQGGAPLAHRRLHPLTRASPSDGHKGQRTEDCGRSSWPSRPRPAGRRPCRTCCRRFRAISPSPVPGVQHITRGFTAGLATWLNAVCDLHVKMAEHGEPLAPHTVYLAPDDRHLGVSPASAVVLSAAPPVGGFRPSGTFLFESAARAVGSGGDRRSS